MGPMLAYNNYYKPCPCPQARHCVINKQQGLCEQMHDEEARTELQFTREGRHNYFERVVTGTGTTEHIGFFDD